MNTAEIYLTRLRQNDKQTEGFLTVWNGIKLHSFFTLELPDRNNETNRSRIPPGVYEWEKYYSPHFKKDVILLKDVPDREMIEIHSGNYYTHTNGCILVGDGLTDINDDGYMDVTSSKDALRQLMAILPDKGIIKINEV